MASSYYQTGRTRHDTIEVPTAAEDGDDDVDDEAQDLVPALSTPYGTRAAQPSTTAAAKHNNGHRPKQEVASSSSSSNGLSVDWNGAARNHGSDYYYDAPFGGVLQRRRFARVAVLVAGLAIAALLATSVVGAVFRGDRPPRTTGGSTTVPPQPPDVAKTADTLTAPGRAQRYDVVVVGGGPAGSVVAARTAAALESHRVALIEAGDGSQRVLGGTEWLFRDRTIFDVPLAWSYVARLKKFLWDVPSGFLALALGGCGIHNAMLYVRALPEDVAAWNATTWTWETLRRQYLALEDWQGDADGAVDQGWAPAEITQVPAWHAVGGPIATSGGIYRDLLARKFLETVVKSSSRRHHDDDEAAAVLVDRVEDFNAPDSRRGAGYYHFNIRDGLRESAASVFLGGTASGYAPLANLDLVERTTVTRLVVEPTTSSPTTTTTTTTTQAAAAAAEYRVVALEIAADPAAVFSSETAEEAVTRVELKPSASVVLAAGAVLTPHLLHRSGVGPPDVLAAAGIPVVAPHARVGVGLQDHPAVGVVFDVAPALTADMAGLYGRFLNWTVTTTTTTTGDAASASDGAPPPFGAYARAFGYPGFSAGAFLDSGVVSEDDDTENEAPPPDLQLTVFPIQIEPHLEEAATTETRGPPRRQAATMRYNQAVATIAVVRPQTRYAVRPSRATGRPEFHLLGGADDADAAAADVGPDPRGRGGLAEADAVRLAAGVRKVRAIFAESPLRDYVIGEAAPGAAVDTQDELLAWVKATYTQNSHWCCSVAFGGGGADAPPLDPRTLRLRGFENLYVADASAFPTIPNGNVHSTVTAVASEFADRFVRDRRAAAASSTSSSKRGRTTARK